MSRAASPTPSPASSAASAVPPQPDHFYPSPFIRPDWRDPNDPEALIWPEEDPAATRGIPVFKPSLEEFKDFEAYVTSIEPWGRKSGIVKVIPPKEWRDSLPSITAQLAQTRLRSPIAQEMLGRSGVFRQSNIEKRKTYSVREWAEICDKEENRTPSPAAALKKERSDRKDSPRKRMRKKPQEAESEDEDAKEEREVEQGTEVVPERDHLAPPTPDSLPDAIAPTVLKAAASAASEPSPSEPMTPDDKFLATFDPQISWLPPDTKPEDYTPEACAQLERNFWRGIGNGGTPAWYGADLKGSLFTDETTSWNVSSLPNPLTRLLDLTNRKLPGVNTPYLYFGMWRAAFAWHVEDMDLYSINYIHFGAPKLWWAIPSEKARAFERTIKGYFPADANVCSQFLRHKSYLVSPTLLANNSCRPNVLVQHQGEFVITFPQGYHAGINLGFNCAESVNFALEGWEDVVRKADWCKCEKDSVKLDIDALLEEAKEIAAEQVKTAKPKEAKVSRKRKVAEPAGEDQPSKKVKRQHPSSERPVKSILLQATAPPIPPTTKACVLCPGSEEDTLVKVHDLPDFMRSMVGVQAWAHECCAAILPETWVDVLDGEKWVFGVDAIEKARWDLKCVACTKLTLKTHGAKIQCTRGKCPRAFHVTCAIERSEVCFRELEQVEKEVILLGEVEEPNASGASGVQRPAGPSHDGHSEVDAYEAATVGSEVPLDRAEASAGRRSLKVIKTIKKPVVELLCPTHNPDIRLQAKQRKDDTRKKNVLALKEGDRIRVRVSSGVFEVTLLRVDEEGEKVEVIWDDQSRRAFKWGSIHWGSVTEEVLAASKAKQEAREDALETKLQQYQESLRLAKKQRLILPAQQSSTSDDGARGSPQASRIPKKPVAVPSTIHSSQPKSFTSVSSIALPTSDSLIAPYSAASAPTFILPQRVESQSHERSWYGQQPQTPSYVAPYPPYDGYPLGYWASQQYPGYWQHPAYPNRGWYDYYGRWHEGYPPGHDEKDAGQGSSAPFSFSEMPERQTPAYNYPPFYASRRGGDTKASSYTSLSDPPVNEQRTSTSKTPRVESPHTLHQPAPAAVAAATESAVSSNDESHPSSLITASDVLNHPNLLPLLNSLMQNEAMRKTLLSLTDSLPGQHAVVSKLEPE